MLALVPYRQISERGFACHDDDAPLRCLVVRERAVLAREDVLTTIPDDPVDVTDGGFDIDDDAYTDIVDAVIHDEIGRGEGANFVIRRDYQAKLTGDGLLRFLADPKETEELLECAADAETGEVHALRGAGFASVQFHLESILSTDGIDLLANLVGDLLLGNLLVRDPRLTRRRVAETAR